MALNIYYILIFLVVIISGPLAPFIILIKSLIKRRKWKNLIKNYGKRFWLSEEEKELFLEYYKYYNTLGKEIEKTEYSINEIYKKADKENIKRNSDGSISNRSNRGKEFNKELSSLSNLKSSIKSKKSNVWLKISRLKRKPNAFWIELKEQYVPYYSYLYTLYFWIICFYILVRYFFKNPTLAFYEMFSYIFNNSQKFIILKEDWGIKILLILISCAVLSLLFNLAAESLIKKYFFKKKYPEPPFVSLKNYDSY